MGRPDPGFPGEIAATDSEAERLGFDDGAGFGDLLPPVCARSGHGVQSFRANRASRTTPFFGYVFGRHERLSFPAGHVTT